jgi:serine/threonine protein kinase
MNLLLTGKDIPSSVLKLGDMGETRVLSHESYVKGNKIVGTPQSMAPEVVNLEGFD